MKLMIGTFALIALAGCTSMPQDPYAANHAAPRQVRLPSADSSCETLSGSAPECQVGDSYAGTCEPVATQDGARKQPKYECQKVTVDCTSTGGAQGLADTFQYVGVGQQDCQ